ncbi:MAG: MFS transporter [Bryobacteraceae bacterium]|jgi:fucose permease
MPNSAPGHAAASTQPPLPAPLARKALAGFFLSGLLFAFPGAILPAWRHYMTQDFVAVGYHFLSMNLGIVLSVLAARLLVRRGKISLLLLLSACVAYLSLMFLAFVPVTAPSYWHMAGIFGIGCATGLLNSGILQAIAGLYRRDRTATFNMAGALFGFGSILIAALVAGTFYVYSVQSILILVALVPAAFIALYARTRFSAEAAPAEPTMRQALADFKSLGAILFALLLFFQFGNEWSIAGWLPLYLMQRLGVSAAWSLVLLALYWLALLVGRVVVFSFLPRVRRAKLLLASVLAALFGCLMLLSTDNLFGAIVAVLLIGGGFASVYPLVAERIGGRFPYYHPGFFNGIFSFALTGGLLAPWSLGYFTSWWGIRVVMGLPLLGTILVFLLLVLIWLESKLTALEQA